MSHFSVLLFHSGGVEGNMGKRYYDATSDDGANVEFEQRYTLKEAEKEYKQYIKSNPNEKKQYPDVDTFMRSYHCLEFNDVFYGSYSNVDGMYDWYEVGGRWANLLPDFSDKKELQKSLNKALNMKNKKAYDMFRDNADLYVKLKEMPLEQACAFLKIGGANSIEISEEIPAETILDWWIASYNADSQTKCSWNRKNITDSVTSYFILEDGPNGEEVINGVDTKSFIDTYNYFVELNKKTQAAHRYQLTILDLHT